MDIDSPRGLRLAVTEYQPLSAEFALLGFQLEVHGRLRATLQPDSVTLCMDHGDGVHQSGISVDSSGAARELLLINTGKEAPGNLSICTSTDDAITDTIASLSIPPIAFMRRNLLQRAQVGDVVVRAGEVLQIVHGNYVFDHSLCISRGGCVYIEPGVTIQFAKGKGIDCQGALIVRGEEEHPVVLQADPASREWYGLSIHGPHVRDTSLKHCVIEDGRGRLARDLNVGDSTKAFLHLGATQQVSSYGGNLLIANTGETPVTLSNVVLRGGEAQFGGGLAAYGSVIRLRGGLICEGNRATDTGGGLWMRGSSLEGRGLQVTGNEADVLAGGAFVQFLGPDGKGVEVHDMSFENNKCSRANGAFFDSTALRHPPSSEEGDQNFHYLFSNE